MNPTIVICGAGGIGRATALILACNVAMHPTIYLGDINENSLEQALSWVTEGMTRDIEIDSFIMPLTGSNAEMEALFEDADVVLDCLPGSQAPRIAALAKENFAHYANLTEYVKETEQIIDMAKNAETAFVLQTGLAPGYINVLACQLFNDFKERHNNDKLESMKMRVGALSVNAVAPYFYAYTWSPIGVATEYVKETIVLKDYKKQTVPSLSGLETLILNGEAFEDNYTSGGAANLPDTFAGTVKNLDYKTLRYPGHYDWVNRSLNAIPDTDNKSKALDDFMQSQIPHVELDRVVIFSQVIGFDNHGILRGMEKAYDIPPTKVGKKRLRSIQATTASSLCEVAYFLVQNQVRGVVLQSQIDPERFLNGPYVSEIYGKYSDD